MAGLLTEDILVPFISGFLLGIVCLIKRKSDEKRQEGVLKNWVLFELRNAFLMKENNLDYRINAWKEYKTLGGGGYVSYIDELLAKKGLKSGEGIGV